MGKITNNALFVALAGPLAAWIASKISPRFEAFLESVRSYALATVSLPRWIFFGWIALSLVALTALLLFWARANAEQPEAVQPRYESDILFGLRWRWQLDAFGWHDFIPFCSKCDNQFLVTDFQPRFEGGATFVCDHCGHTGTIEEHYIQDTARRAEREAQRRYRNEDWRAAPQRISSAKQ